MKKLVILGAGTGGTIMANKMRKELPGNEWEITVVDQHPSHYYQPGFLFLPFGFYEKKQIIKPIEKFINKGINLILEEIDRIEGESNKVHLKNSQTLDYDILIIATGARTNPDETPCLKDKLWMKKIFDVYTIEGSEALNEFFKTWEGGKLVINVADMPIKCPVAPLEFAFYADQFFTTRGIRDRVDITYVTPLSGAFTKPMASQALGNMLEKKNINLVTDFFIGEVDNDNQKIIDFGGNEVEFDCLMSVPLHSGDELITRSGLGDDFGFVPTNKHTLQSNAFENVFVIGDAGNFPSSKAGSVIHFQAEILYKNIKSFINNKSLEASFDGHSNCYIETGFGKGILIDFNYETEPLPGLFPLPLVGPFSLLKENRVNHYGKLLFKWIYWYILLKNRWLPVPTNMWMAGKKRPKNKDIKRKQTNKIQLSWQQKTM